MSEAAATLAAPAANTAPAAANPAAQPAAAPAAASPAPAQTDADLLAVVPESAEEYGIEFPDDADGAKMAAEWFKDAKLTKAQAQALVEKRAQAFAAQQQAAEQAEQAEQARIASQVKADDAALKKEWGDRYEANIELGRRLVRQFEIPNDVLEAVESKIGYGQMLRMFSRMGAGLAEDSAAGLNGTTGDRGGKTAEQKLYPGMQ
jgi:hypothetical protein